MRYLRHFANCSSGRRVIAVSAALFLGATVSANSPTWAADDRPGADRPNADRPNAGRRDLDTRPISTGPRTARPVEAKPPSIRIEKLDDPGSDAVGLLSRSNGGFGSEMWRGSDRQEVTAYLGTMPTTAALPERSSLLRRMLLTSAVPPSGEGTLSDLVSIRLDRLYSMGRLPDLAALARLVKIDKPNSIRVEAEIAGLLLERNVDEACPRVRRYLANKPGDFLKRALLVCLKLTGKTEELNRLVAILQEDDPKAAPVLVALTRGDPKKIDVEKLGSIDPLTLSLAIGVGAKVPPAWTKTDKPPLQRALALHADLPVAARLRAAEAAFVVGALSRKELTDIYMAAAGGQKDDPGRIELKRYDAMARARMYAAAKANDDWTRLSILGRWWVLARARGDFALTARVTAPLVAELKPSRQFIDQAPLASRVLFFVGETDKAAAWYALLAKSPFKDIEQEDDLALLATIAGAKETGWNEARLRRWLSRRVSGKAGRSLAGATFAIMDGFGVVSERRKIWMTGVPQNARLSAAGSRWYAIQRAAENRQLGEALTRFQVTIGDVPLTKAPPNDLRQTIRILRQLKLDAEARRLAVQVLLAKGL